MAEDDTKKVEAAKKEMLDEFKRLHSDVQKMKDQTKKVEERMKKLLDK